MHGIVQQPFRGCLEFGHVGQRADKTHDFPVGADDRARLQRKPEIVAVSSPQAKVLQQPAAPLLKHRIQCGAETIAILRMQHVQPLRGRALERAAAETEQLLGF